MRECDFFRQALAELDSTENEEALADHLDRCESCRALVESKLVPPPEGFPAPVYENYPGTPPEFPPSRETSPLLPLALASLLLAALLALWPSEPPASLKPPQATTGVERDFFKEWIVAGQPRATLTPALPTLAENIEFCFSPGVTDSSGLATKWFEEIEEAPPAESWSTNGQGDLIQTIFQIDREEVWSTIISG